LKFRAAKRNRIFQDVVGQIQEAILDRELKPGDMLPSERELKEMFGTSRGTLREALRVLEQKGLIEIRLGAGGGAVVVDAPATPLSESLDLLIRLQKISLDHLAEFREGVEGTVAALAAQRATPADLEWLNERLREAEEQVGRGPARWDAFLEADKRIHQALARIAGNPLYILIHQMVHDNIHRYYDRLLSIDAHRMQQNYRDLQDIVSAVGAGDANGARDTARRHVRRFGEYMRRSLSADRAADLNGNGNRIF
jgi:DNA-binding FadR family transcriptional regulator